jgi:SAM-dependent methyltransferase
MKSLPEILYQPFRDSARINRKVVISYLRELKGKFLEVGPGKDPLLNSLDIDNKQKIFIDLPGAFPRKKEPGILYIEQDAGCEKWKLKNESVDVVVSSQCMEHIPDTDHFLSESYRVLSKGGAFIVSVPNQGALVFILMMLMTLNPTMNEVSNCYIGLGNPFSTNRFKRRTNYSGYTHLRLFTIRAMQDLLTVYKFRVVKKHGGTWGIPWIGEFIARIFPYYGLFTIVLARKESF